MVTECNLAPLSKWRVNFIFMVGAGIFSQFNNFELKFMQANSKEQDQTPHFWCLILALSHKRELSLYGLAN